MGGIIDGGREQKVPERVNERKTKERKSCERDGGGRRGRKERDRRAPGWRWEGYIHRVHPFVPVITICALSDAAHSHSGRCTRGCCIAPHCESNRFSRSCLISVYLARARAIPARPLQSRARKSPARDPRGSRSYPLIDLLHADNAITFDLSESETEDDEAGERKYRARCLLRYALVANEPLTVR